MIRSNKTNKVNYRQTLLLLYICIIILCTWL